MTSAYARAAVLLSLLPGLAGCAAMPAAPCVGGASERVVAELLFGRNIGDRVSVSESAFKRFVDEEVTRRFPDGLTIFDARGQYRDGERNRLVREPSKVILIVLSDEARDSPRLTEVVEAYKRRFNQQSVGVITRRSCVAF
jgi:hypothetical protein